MLALSFTSCSGDDECNAVLEIPDASGSDIFAQDLDAIATYLEANDLPVNSTDSGLHFIINEQGGPNSQGRLNPELCDEVNVDYRGYLLDGTVFDEGEGITLSLMSVIRGWSEGIPLYSQGGSGTLIIPSYLGYGVRPPTPLIPVNAVLLFDIDLNSF